MTRRTNYLVHAKAPHSLPIANKLLLIHSYA